MTLALISQSTAIAPVSRAVPEFFSQPEGLDARIAILPAPSDLAVSPYSMLRPASREFSPGSQTIWTAIAENLRRDGTAPQ